MIERLETVAPDLVSQINEVTGTRGLVLPGALPAFLKVPGQQLDIDRVRRGWLNLPRLNTAHPGKSLKITGEPPRANAQVASHDAQCPAVEEQGEHAGHATGAWRSGP